MPNPYAQIVSYIIRIISWYNVKTRRIVCAYYFYSSGLFFVLLRLLYFDYLYMFLLIKYLYKV
jgi:hypothetical protein